jgi:hypothetical protein
VEAIAFHWRYVFPLAFFGSLLFGSAIRASPLSNSEMGAQVTLGFILSALLGYLGSRVPSELLPTSVKPRALTVHLAMMGFIIGCGAYRFAFIRRAGA